MWDNSNGWEQIGGEGLTRTSYTLNGLAAETTYYFAIRAVNADNETSAWSEYLQLTTAASSPQGQQQQVPQHTPTATSTLTVTATPTATARKSRKTEPNPIKGNTSLPTPTPYLNTHCGDFADTHLNAHAGLLSPAKCLSWHQAP